MTKLWSIDGKTLRPLSTKPLEAEDRLEIWLESDISMLDPDLLVIGRQTSTPHGGRMDFLAINSEGSTSIIELKRDRTPRDIVAQVLDYASWITELDTTAIHEIANIYWRSKGLTFVEAFQEKFGTTPPELLNATHTMVIVASALDPASERIVQYLSKVHDVGINTAFFTVFSDANGSFLSADWLMDQDEVVQRTERGAKTPWSGNWYVNSGEGPSRSWEDMRNFGFVAAGGGRFYSAPLDKLGVGESIFVYQKGHGYVGYGVVTHTSVIARDVIIDGHSLLALPLLQPNLGHDREDEALAEYVVRVKWLKAVGVREAKTFLGAFANQHVVCRLRDPQTLEFLEKEFETRQPS